MIIWGLRMHLHHLAKCFLSMAVLFFSANFSVQSQTFPQRSVRIIIPHAPAGPADTVARELAHHLSSQWGQSIINDNKSGANGSIGAELVAKALPDGYTLLLTSMGVVAVNPTLNHLKFDTLKDLAPVALVANSSNVLVVSPSLGVKNVQEFIQLMKNNPQKMNFGSAGVGTASHLSMEIFNQMAGIKMLHVPYKGASPALTDLMGNQVQAFMSGITGALPYIQSGKLIPIGVTSTQTIPFLPNVPPIGKTLPGFELGNWYGLFAPAGTPKAIVQQINQDIRDILQNPEVKKTLFKTGFENVPSLSSDQFTQFVRSEIDKWSKLIKTSNITAN